MQNAAYDILIFHLMKQDLF